MPRLVIEDHSTLSLLRTGVFLELDGQDLGRISCGSRADFQIDPGRHSLQAVVGRTMSAPVHFTVHDRQTIGFVCKVSGALNKSVSLAQSFALGSGGRFGSKTQSMGSSHAPTARASHDTTAWPHVLGVPETASLEEIRRAYLELMRHYHPDRLAWRDFTTRRLAEESARRLNVAYDAAKKARSRSQPGAA